MKKEKLEIKLIFKSIFFLVIILAITFITAGHIDYWQGWVYNGLNAFFMILTYIFLSEKRDLIKERLKPGKGMKKWDKIYFILSTPIGLIMIVISILDSGRFGWEPRVSLGVIVLGIGGYIAGQTIGLWAKRVNRFFSSVVRIQLDRGQTVCKDGPYRFIRHPGYVGGILCTVATPILLGSFWGLIPAVVTVILLFVRTYLEDKTLQAELPGYMDFTKEVRYRLLPGIW
ncbi:unnamed protein product [marine sediment metagenome]|uniref:Steroid 5-alpha reductase C-terminal domain-containing protein n=2 Tax=marine sediment metagenome TaxID=412755 RepID=X0ZKE1_9ZZZZ